LRGPEVSRPVAFRGGGFVARSSAWAGWVVLLVTLALWQGAASAGWIDSLFFPAPYDVGRALWRLTASGQMGAHVAASMKRLLAGLALGASLGVLVGLAAGLVSAARMVASPLVSALFPVPKIALLPLFILWFGIGEPSKIATIAFGAFFPMVIATMGGVDAVDRGLIRMAQSFGTPAGAIVRKVALPAAAPSILSGLRIATSIGIVLIVAAEMIGAKEGLGAFTLAAGNLMAVDELMAGVVVIAAIGVAFAALIGAAERRVLRWR
jgi:NitT/TauT family transport system permease protein